MSDYGFEAVNDQISVVIICLETMNCIEARAENISEWGCSVHFDRQPDIGREVVIRSGNAPKAILSHVTSVNGNSANIYFQKELRHGIQAKSQPVRIPVSIVDNETRTSIECVIVEASKTGCRFEGEGVEELGDSVWVFTDKVRKPMSADIVWRDGNRAAAEINWDAEYRHEHNAPAP